MAGIDGILNQGMAKKYIYMIYPDDTSLADSDDFNRNWKKECDHEVGVLRKVRICLRLLCLAWNFRGDPLRRKLGKDAIKHVARSIVEISFHALPEFDTKTTAIESPTSSRLDNRAYNNIRDENVVIRALLPDIQHPKHETTPIFKLVDFGSLTYIETGQETVILSDEPEVSFTADGIELCTEKKALIRKNVDGQLIDLVCWCLAKNPSYKPEDDNVFTADETIKARMIRLLVNAGIAPHALIKIRPWLSFSSPG
ncbi:hypothetical protein BKA67DRAFT_535268 [Truncatella angustata]|uniref:Uncharacterized protein n=1 Tax=Truncatella angustata TaxID=152316 RepID=A0A9P8UKH7_9PEZI|nr:uncharacterized protein BKA67DRAFT_535268 [Truncatella angustata]KAH6653922.1 hypothetical protein BKA67DRAFT_535268 [Truncatella angustata]